MGLPGATDCPTLGMVLKVNRASSVRSQTINSGLSQASCIYKSELNSWIRDVTRCRG